MSLKLRLIERVLGMVSMFMRNVSAQLDSRDICYGFSKINRFTALWTCN